MLHAHGGTLFFRMASWIIPIVSGQLIYAPYIFWGEQESHRAKFWHPPVHPLTWMCFLVEVVDVLFHNIHHHRIINLVLYRNLHLSRDGGPLLGSPPQFSRGSSGAVRANVKASKAQPVVHQARVLSGWNKTMFHLFGFGNDGI